MSCCPSSGFNHQPCSQSQKMSIGVVVESVAKSRCGFMKEAGVSIRHSQKEASDAQYLTVKHNVQSGVKASSIGTMCKNDAQEGSVRVTSGLPAASLIMKDSDHIENQTSRPAISCLYRKQPTRSMQSSANQVLLEPVVGKKTEPDRASGKVSKRASMDESLEKFSCAPKQVCFPVKEVLPEQQNEMENRSKEVLRMKLREILGTVPSGNKILGDSRTSEANANEMMREQTLKGDAHFKPRQNSDTIETDSENVDMTNKRPVTRSFARRRPPAKMQPRNFKPKSLSTDKEERIGSDVFTFAEKSAPSQPCAVTQGFSIVEKNDHTKRSCGIKPGDKLSPVKDLRNIQTEISGCEKEPPAVEFLYGGVATFSKRGCRDENPEPEAAMRNVKFNYSPVVREKSQQSDAESPAPLKESQWNIKFNHSPVVRGKSQLPDVESPALQKESQFFEPFGGQSPVPHVDDLSCPRYKMLKAVLNSPLRTYDKKHNVRGSAQAEAEIRLEAKCSFKSSTDSDKDTFASSDDVVNVEDTNSSTSESSTEEKSAGKELFPPIRGEFDSTEEVSSAKKAYPEVAVHTSPENGSRPVWKPVVVRRKRHSSHDVDSTDISPTLHSPEERGNSGDVLTECLDEIPEDGTDGLARVVSLLGLELEKVKTKMMSVTNKKCSEILVSAAEEIHSQLQNVESQIQTDLVKLTSLKTSKRKHLETRLEEQQEHLKVMHEKFKEEISQYLQDCKGTLERLETQNIELRGAVKRQKVLHSMLLLQTEAAVETHLIDAQRQMIFVHKKGKQKMQQLKAAITGCLKHGISG
ncbi:hypothetical protein SOVF_169100 isoform B [Spinacia oleracea]|nr:hypothetical protein SOVF_169100 isoform B [Spinacia oleracea]